MLNSRVTGLNSQVRCAQQSGDDATLAQALAALCRLLLISSSGAEWAGGGGEFGGDVAKGDQVRDRIKSIHPFDTSIHLSDTSIHMSDTSIDPSDTSIHPSDIWIYPSDTWIHPSDTSRQPRRHSATGSYCCCWRGAPI
jgi:hypothetical protein